VLGFTFAPLPRYYTQVVPFAFFGLLGALRRELSDRRLVVLLLLAVTWFGINRNGDLYPDNHINNFALIERSGAYVSLLELQQKGIQALTGVPDDVSVFYDQAAHYKLTYPIMGYAQGPIAEGHSILHERPYLEGRLADFPEEFYMLYEYSWLGGDLIRSVWDQAIADPGRDVVVEKLCSSAFCSDFIHVTPAAAP